MAAYEYDEAGVMAAYFLITFLALVLVPLTISAFKKSGTCPFSLCLWKGSSLIFTPDKAPLSGCQCSVCLAHQETLQKESKGSLLNPKISRRLGLPCISFFFHTDITLIQNMAFAWRMVVVRFCVVSGVQAQGGEQDL